VVERTAAAGFDTDDSSVTVSSSSFRDSRSVSVAVSRCVVADADQREQLAAEFADLASGLLAPTS
jgi:hypothetical protein